MTIDPWFFLLGVFLGWSLVKVYYWGKTTWKQGELSFHLEGIELIRSWFTAEEKVIQARVKYSEILIKLSEDKHNALSSVIDQVSFHIDVPLPDFSDDEQRMEEMAIEIEELREESNRIGTLIEERGEYSGYSSNL